MIFSHLAESLQDKSIAFYKLQVMRLIPSHLSDMIKGMVIKGGIDMEAVTIAGLAVVTVGGYYALLDLLNDAGVTGRVKKFQKKGSLVCGRDIITPQSRVKKMAGMHI